MYLFILLLLLGIDCCLGQDRIEGDSSEYTTPLSVTKRELIAYSSSRSLNHESMTKNGISYIIPLNAITTIGIGYAYRTISNSLYEYSSFLKQNTFVFAASSKQPIPGISHYALFIESNFSDYHHCASEFQFSSEKNFSSVSLVYSRPDSTIPFSPHASLALEFLDSYWLMQHMAISTRVFGLHSFDQTIPFKKRNNRVTIEGYILGLFTMPKRHTPRLFAQKTTEIAEPIQESLALQIGVLHELHYNDLLIHQSITNACIRVIAGCVPHKHIGIELSPFFMYSLAFKDVDSKIQGGSSVSLAIVCSSSLGFQLSGTKQWLQNSVPSMQWYGGFNYKL